MAECTPFKTLRAVGQVVPSECSGGSFQQRVAFGKERRCGDRNTQCRRHTDIFDNDVSIHIDGPPDRNLQKLEFRHQEKILRSPKSCRWVVGNDLRTSIQCHIVGKKFAGAGAVRACDHSDGPRIAQRLIGQVHLIDTVRVEIKIIQFFVVVATLAQFFGLVEEIGRHLIGQETASSAILAHVDDQAWNFVAVECFEHTLPQLYSEQLVVRKAVDFDIAQAIVEQAELDRQFSASPPDVEGRDPEALTFYIGGDQSGLDRGVSRILEGDLDLAADRCAGGVAQLLQAAHMLRREGRRKGNDAVHILVDRLAVPGQDHRPALDPGPICWAVWRHKTDDRALIFDIPNCDADPSSSDFDKLLLEKGGAEVAIWDRPDKIAQCTSVGQGIGVGLSRLKQGTKFSCFGGPVDSFEFGERILVDEKVEHGVERFGVAQL